MSLSSAHSADNLSIDAMRARLHRWLVGLAWAHVAIAPLAALQTGADLVVWTLVAAALAALATVAPRLPDAALGRGALLVALQAQVAVIVGALAGHPWQADAHMYFFAIMGVGVMLIDVRALLAAAGFVALHHLALNFLAASFVFPDGESFGRTLLHAVILIVETSALVVAVVFIQRLFDAAQASAADAQAQLEAARDAGARAEHSEAEAAEARRETLRALETSFAEVIDAVAMGDFSKRAPTDFDAAEFNRLGEAVNRLVEQMELSVAAAVDALERFGDGDMSARMDGAFDGRFAD
ncbi:MAG: hypothetical protein AAFR16_00590, partial [Pseudomonadota bacterium]